MKHNQTDALFMNGTGVLNHWLGITVKKTTMADYTGNEAQSDWCTVYEWYRSAEPLTGHNCKENNNWRITLEMKHNQTGALFMNGTGVLNHWLGITVKKTTMADYTGNQAQSDWCTVYEWYRSAEPLTGHNCKENNNGGLHWKWSTISLVHCLWMVQECWTTDWA